MSRKRVQTGFNLIELTIVILIIGILIAIAMPNFFSAQDRAKTAAVKANMHTFQTVLESYAIDWGGVYAPNVNGLKIAGSEPGREFWQEFANPYSALTGEGKAYGDADVLPAPEGANAGLVLYNPAAPGPVFGYFIYGLDKVGSPIQDKGTVYYLTNS